MIDSWSGSDAHRSRVEIAQLGEPSFSPYTVMKSARRERLRLRVCARLFESFFRLPP